MKTPLIAVLTSFILMGCTAVDVSPIADHHNPELICLKMNRNVIVGGFEEAVEQRLHHHGIKTRRFDGYRTPRECEYTLSYTAFKTWDITTYLHRAELYLSHQGSPIANATYRLRGKGGLTFGKYASVRTKMNPVVDQLLGIEG